MIALDASALLAFLFREPGHDIVAEHLGDAALSTVNLAEVLGRFARDGHDPTRVRSRLAALPIRVVPFEVSTAELVARLEPPTRPLGLSLGDRACLALALELGVPALTADRDWADLEIGVEVVLVR